MPTLHILPLGDSITEGFRSSDGNGYRLRLLCLLLHGDTGRHDNDCRGGDGGSGGDRGGRGVHVNATYLGSLHSGNMSGNAHEGHGGFTIEGVRRAFREFWERGSRGYDEEDEDEDEDEEGKGPKPGVVLLHAGTNDMNIQPSISVDTALGRLGGLVDDILERYPRATVVVAAIVQSSFERTRRRIGEFDAGVPGMVRERAESGHRVLLADMGSIGADGEDLADGLHPDDVGYGRMARVWYSALEEAASEGWIPPIGRPRDDDGYGSRDRPPADTPNDVQRKRTGEPSGMTG